MPVGISPQKLPLEQECTKLPPRVEYVDSAVLFVPLSDMKPNALTFSDLRHPQWIGITQVFYRLCQVITHSGRGYAYNEGILAKNSSNIYGYAFWLFLTDETGKSLNEEVGEIVLYNANHMAEAMEGKPAGLAHQKWKNQPRYQQPDERWKLIDGFHEWKHMVSFCVGVSTSFGVVDPEKHIAEIAFSPHAAFGAHLQNIDVDLTKYDQVSDTGLRQCNWPHLPYVYKFPRDLCTPLRLMRTMLPHIQADMALVEYERESLLPLVVKINNKEITDFRKRKADRGNDSASGLEQKRQRRGLFQIDPKARLSNSAGMASAQFVERAAARSKKISAVDSEWDIQRKRYEELIANNNLFVDNKRKASERPDFYLKASMTNIVANGSVDGFKVGTEEWSKRLVHLTIQDIATSEFSGRMDTGLMRSDYERAIDDAVATHQLFDTEKFKRWAVTLEGNKITKTVHDNGLFTAWGIRFLANMESAFAVNHAHFQIYDKMIAAFDAWNLNRKQKIHQLDTSEKGGQGKSFTQEVVMGLLIDGTWKKITWLTPASLACETEPDDNGHTHANFDGAAWFFDELSRRMLVSADGSSVDEVAARMKQLLTDQGMIVMTLFIDPDTGKRSTRTFKASHNFVLFGCANIKLDELDHPMLRRFKCNPWSEGPPKGRTVTQRQFESFLSKVSETAQKLDFRRECNFLQACNAMIGRLISANVISNVGMDLMGVFMPRLFDSLLEDTKEAPMFTEPESSTITRLQNYARLLCINRVVISEFLHPARNKGVLTVKDFVALERHLFLTCGDIIGAVGHLVNEILQPLDFAVMIALRTHFYNVLRRDEPLRNNFQLNFAPTARPEEHDPNYVRFDTQHLINALSKLVPQFMTNYVPSVSSINAVLKKFTRSTDEQHGYEFHKSGGMVTENKKIPKTTVDLFRYEGHIHRGTGRYFDVHVSVFGDFVVANEAFLQKYEKTFLKDLLLINWRIEYERNNSLEDCHRTFSRCFQATLYKRYNEFTSNLNKAISNMGSFPMDHGLDWKKEYESLPEDPSVDNAVMASRRSNHCLAVFKKHESDFLRSSFEIGTEQVATYKAAIWKDDLHVFVENLGNGQMVPQKYKDLYSKNVTTMGAGTLDSCYVEMIKDMQQEPGFDNVVDYIVHIETEKFKVSLNEAIRKKWNQSAIKQNVEFPAYEPDVTNVTTQIKNVLDKHIALVTGKKYQIKQKAVLGPDPLHPTLFANVEYGQSDPLQGDSFVIKTASSTPKTLDEYSRNKYSDKRSYKKDSELQVDLDTFALAVHNRNLHITGAPVTHTHVKDLKGINGSAKVQESTADAGQWWESNLRHEEETSYFMGYNAKFIDPDHLENFVPSVDLMSSIKTLLEKDPVFTQNYACFKDDIDFNVEDYKLANGQYHWEHPDFAKELEPTCFGFQGWRTDNIVRAMQYKLVATHPVIKQHYLRLWSKLNGDDDNGKELASDSEFDSDDDVIMAKAASIETVSDQEDALYWS